MPAFVLTRPDRSRQTMPGVPARPSFCMSRLWPRIFAASDGWRASLASSDPVHGLPKRSSILRNAAVVSGAARTSIALGRLVGPSVSTRIQRTCSPALS